MLCLPRVGWPQTVRLLDSLQEIEGKPAECPPWCCWVDSSSRVMGGSRMQSRGFEIVQLIRKVVDMRSEIGELRSETNCAHFRVQTPKMIQISIFHSSKSPLARFSGPSRHRPILNTLPHRICGPYLGGMSQPQTLFTANQHPSTNRLSCKSCLEMEFVGHLLTEKTCC